MSERKRGELMGLGADFTPAGAPRRGKSRARGQVRKSFNLSPETLAGLAQILDNLRAQGANFSEHYLVVKLLDADVRDILSGQRPLRLTKAEKVELDL